MSPITSNIFHEISWSIWFESVVQQCGHCFTILLDMFDLDCCTFFFPFFYFVELLCKHWKCYLIWSLSWWKLGWSNTSTNAFIWSLWPCHSAHVDMLEQQTCDLSSLKFAFCCIWLIGFAHSDLFYELTSIVAEWYWISPVQCLGCHKSVFFWKVNALIWIFAFANLFFFFFLLYFGCYSVIFACCICYILI